MLHFSLYFTRDFLAHAQTGLDVLNSNNIKLIFVLFSIFLQLCAKKTIFLCSNACHYARPLAVYDLSHKHQIHATTPMPTVKRMSGCFSEKVCTRGVLTVCGVILGEQPVQPWLVVLWLLCLLITAVAVSQLLSSHSSSLGSLEIMLYMKPWMQKCAVYALMFIIQ